MKFVSALQKYIPQIYTLLKPVFTGAQKCLAKIGKIIKKHFSSWRPISLFLISSIILLYYPLGSLMINNLSTISYQPQSQKGASATIESLDFIIKHEVRQKIWTPNLPFLFPSYFLDNMPNFQLGAISAVGNTTKALTHLSFEAISQDETSLLKKAADYLQYPGTVWLFSAHNNLTPSPSSPTQYKKGQKLLRAFNQSLINQQTSLSFDAHNLSVFLKSMRNDWEVLSLDLADHVRENQNSFLDFKADNVFYQGYGKIYAYSQIAKGLGYDFKATLVKYDVYAVWTSLLKTLNEVENLKPLIIRNAPISSSFSPNHLIALNYYVNRAINLSYIITNKLSQPVEK